MYGETERAWGGRFEVQHTDTRFEQYVTSCRSIGDYIRYIYIYNSCFTLVYVLILLVCKWPTEEIVLLDD